MPDDMSWLADEFLDRLKKNYGEAAAKSPPEPPTPAAPLPTAIVPRRRWWAFWRR